jgi:S1-C subfamily serine protease
VAIIVFDAAADPGDSGGPIFDDNGLAIGMVYGFLESTGGKRTTGQQLGTNYASIKQVWEELKLGNNTTFK